MPRDQLSRLDRVCSERRPELLRAVVDSTRRVWFGANLVRPDSHPPALTCLAVGVDSAGYGSAPTILSSLPLICLCSPYCAFHNNGVTRQRLSSRPQRQVPYATRDVHDEILRLDTCMDKTEPSLEWSVLRAQAVRAAHASRRGSRRRPRLVRQTRSGGLTARVPQDPAGIRRLLGVR
jgi:hypothetical protein